MADVKGYNMPDDLYYHKDHAWARVDGTKVTVGMNDFFQKESGDIVFIDLPDTEDEVSQGEVCGARSSPANGSESSWRQFQERSWRPMRLWKTTRAWSTQTILKEAIEHDVLIDIPVFKNHYGARISGSIKNLLGFNWNSISFHQGETYLQQSIADLASVIRPHLCVVDATTILADNGPGGPGRTIQPNQVIAGTDMVALDAFCCPLLNVIPADVGHIVYLGASGHGQADISRKRVREISL